MDEFDIIVVGGGSAGSAAAGRLSESGKFKVCLVEAGGTNDTIRVKTPGFMPFIPDASNYRYETVPQKGLNGRTGYQPRGRGLGGSSAINAMVYIRGHAFDYDNWAALGCDGWAYDDVLPYFKRAENNERGGDAYHGTGGPLNVSRLCGGRCRTATAAHRRFQWRAAGRLWPLPGDAKSRRALVGCARLC